MLFKSKILHAFGVLTVIFLLAFAALGDTIRLKDGSIIKGRIVRFGNGKFTVAIGEGSRQRELELTASDVESIQFDAMQTPAAETKKMTVVTTPYGDDKPIAAAKSSSLPAKSDSLPKTVKSDDTSQIVKTSAIKTPPAITNSKPIELNIKVLADNTANGWTNSGWVVKRGQKIRITGSGTISLGKGQTTTSSGLYDIEDVDKLLKSVPTGALLAVIGDDNNDFIYIGAEREFVAARDGALFLGVNEGNLNDNSGSFDVKIEILP